MKHMRMGLFSAVMLAVLLFALSATKAYADQQTVTGILESVVAVGAETPGWAVRLDEPIVVAGRIYDSVEVYSADEDLSPLKGAHVTATGIFVQWRTPERGKFVVMELCEITPVK